MKKYVLVLVLLGGLFVVKTAKAATLSLNPTSGSFATGQTFDVNVNLDTTGQEIDGVDLFYLRFDPSLVQVVDADTKASGVQIKPGTLFPLTAANSVDNSSGKITFSQVTIGGTHYKGAGVLATISLRALQSGTANLTLDFTKGNTADTNVAGSGKDQLTQVTNAKFTITGTAVVPPPPSTIPSQTPDNTSTDAIPAKPNINTTPSSSSNTNMLIYGLAGLMVVGGGVVIWYLVRKKSNNDIQKPPM